MTTGYAMQTWTSSDQLHTIDSFNGRYGGAEMNANMTYQINTQLNLSGGYQLQNTPPLLSQILTYPNLTNPLTTIVGNPHLQSSSNQLFKLNLSSFNLRQNRHIYFRTSYIINKDQIVSFSDINDVLINHISYINGQGGKAITSTLTVNQQLLVDSLSRLQLEFNVHMSGYRTPNYYDKVWYQSDNGSLFSAIKINYQLPNRLQIMGTYRLSINKSRFTHLNPTIQTNWSHNAELSATFYLSESLCWSNSSVFNFIPSINQNHQNINWIWSSKFTFSAGNRTNIALTIFDVLNRNNGLNQIVTSTYIENSSSLVLKRYLMINLNWKFSKF